MKKLNKREKIVLMSVLLPLLFVAQYYIFKFGIISPMIKGVNIKIIQGEYIQDIDKYVVKLGDEVTLSAGDYIKVPKYAKDPKIKFSILDNSKTIKLEDNSQKEENTVILKALKTGYTSVAVMKNSRVLQKATILVVDPDIEDLNVSLDGDLRYVGDEAELSSYVQVDYKEFNNTYKVTYESSDENILKIKDNKVSAVGVGKATIYAKSKDKVEAIRLNIVARVKEIQIDSSFDISVGQAIKLNPKIITYPRNLKPPTISYKFSQSKLPIERAVTFDEDGTIVGIRSGSEKITISCGEGENKRIEVVTINVKEGNLENSMIRNLLSDYIIEDNKLKIALSWDILNGATNYDIFIKDELDEKPIYELYKSITQEEFLKKSKIRITIDLKDDRNKVAYDIYIVARNEEGTSKPSNVESIRDTIKKEDSKPEDDKPQDNNTDDSDDSGDKDDDNNKDNTDDGNQDENDEDNTDDDNQDESDEDQKDNSSEEVTDIE